MNKTVKFKDVAHFYLGCEGLDHNNQLTTLSTIVLAKYQRGEVDFKPILKSIKDIEVEHGDELGWADTKSLCSMLRDNPFLDAFDAIELIFLIAHGYDCFGLIKNGEAYNRKEQNASN